MKIHNNLPKLFVFAFFAAGAGIIISNQIKPSGDAAQVSAIVPDLSPLAQEGEKAFNANCAKCHGVNGAGTDKGPPFIHKIYNPGHHADGAFVFAVRNGVRQHHWPFGNMPPQPQVSDSELRAIVQYVRELQVANGITFEPHSM